MPPQMPEPPDGVFLRAMHNFYAVYLGVTPPPPQKAALYAGIVIGGTLTLVLFLVLFVWFLLGLMAGR